MSDEHRIEGNFRARAIANSDQYGKSESGGDQVAVDLVIVSEGPEAGRLVTSALAFAGKAKPWSMDRLKALGWTGEITEDEHMIGLDTNEVPIRVYYETFNGKESMKVEIVSSRFTMKEPMSDPEKRSFLRELQDLAKKTPDKRAAAGAGNPYPADWDANEAPPTAAAPVDLG